MSSLIVSTANVPTNFCHRSWQETWSILSSLLTVEFNGSLNTFVRSITEPAPVDRDKPWFRLNPNGSPDRVYAYWNGQWVSPHPIPPGPAGVVVMFEGPESSIPVYDSGEVGTVTETSGPFWEKVSQMDARSPLGPGTLPSSTIVALGDTGGEEKHTMTIDELVTHNHLFATGDQPKSLIVGMDPNVREGTINQTGSLDYKALQPLQNAGTSKPFNVMHPYYGIFFIRRTGRIFYRV